MSESSEKSKREKILNLWAVKPTIDIFFVIILLTIHFVLVMVNADLNFIANLEEAHRWVIYGALATVATLAGASNNTAVASYSSANGRFVRRLRLRYGSDLRRNFRLVGAFLWLAAVLSILALCLDNGSEGSNGSEWLFEGGFLVTIVMFIRLTFLQDMLLEITDNSQASDGQSPRARTKNEYKRPASLRDADYSKS